MAAADALYTPEPKPLQELSALRELGRLGGWRALGRAPRGRARVLVVPGFMTSDGSTFVLRRSLRRLGHEVRGWGLGRNRGDVPELLPRLEEQVLAFAAAGPVHLVGWSLGGYLAREVARDHPEAIARVITLGSPVVGGPKYTAAAQYYRRQGVDLDAIEAEIAARTQVELQVPVTAVYSPRDAVVCPAACIDHASPRVRHVAVDCAHAGLGFSPDVIGIIANELADAQ